MCKHVENDKTTEWHPLEEQQAPRFGRNATHTPGTVAANAQQCSDWMV